MNFIQKAIKQNKEKKEIEYQQSVCIVIPTIEITINNLKNRISYFGQTKHNITQENIDNFLYFLDILNSSYINFLFDLRLYQQKYKQPYNSDIKDDIKEKIDYMLEKKKEYRKEFESIYDNFKRTTKGVDFPRRNEILGLMRKAFDFDSSKYYQYNTSN
ncbi:MAG: hypothetical protein ACLRFE_01170 [Clostridia bacterium]